jgi:predicted phosphodiesterase
LKLTEFARENTVLKDKDLIEAAEKRGFTIYKPHPQQPVAEFDTSRLRGKRIRVAFVSDTHMGSRYQQLTHLQTFVQYARKEAKVDAFVHGGDMTDGPHEMHLGSIHEKFCSTYDAQREYTIANLPEFGRPTHVISGNHDESYLKNAGGDIVQDICSARGFTYIGRSEGYIRFGDILVAVMHPHMPGNAITLSRPLQRIIEQVSPENKPHMLACGNWHKAVHLPGYRNVEGFMLPSFQSQTPFMSSKGIASIIGGVIVEFGIIASGLAPSLKVEWVLFRQPTRDDYPR